MRSGATWTVRYTTVVAVSPDTVEQQTPDEDDGAKIIEKFQAEGNTLNKPRTGRPPIFTDRERRIIVGNVKKNPKISAPKLTTDVKNNFAKSCNPETIRRVLRKARYHGRNMQRKPFFSKVNRKKRIDLAKENEKQDRNFSNSVTFSDESKFNIHGSDGHQKVWRKANAALETKNMRGNVKHGGGSIMVWGSMAVTGLKTPPQSPDLNPIKHLWDYLDRQIRKQEIKTKNDLKKALLEEWQKIPSSVTQNLVKSVPSRLRAVIKAKGYPTNY
ncbi:transposable element Tcb1 transposase [Trichonephila clavipes]|uniref:Transposable element Tcb1 transposase n=1 Tax=Trichonephila clavipes TaxID=2585209 RepID=A0A8X6T7L6_TRICX|nr:transposable element Tcb1 transposase [Trichonephila clavipes]